MVKIWRSLCLKRQLTLSSEMFLSLEMSVLSGKGVSRRDRPSRRKGGMAPRAVQSSMAEGPGAGAGAHSPAKLVNDNQHLFGSMVGAASVVAVVGA